LTKFYSFFRNKKIKRPLDRSLGVLNWQALKRREACRP